METFAGLWGYAKCKMDHLLPAHLKEEKKNVLKAVAIVETTNRNAMMVPTVKITEDPAQILSDYNNDGDEVAALGLTLSRSNTASTHSSSSGAYNDSFNSSGNSSMTSLVSSGSEATIGGDGKAVNHRNLLDDSDTDYTSETTHLKSGEIKPCETRDADIYKNIGSIADAKIPKTTNDLIKTQSAKMEFPAGGSIKLICGKLYVPSKSSSIADVTAEVSPETKAIVKKPSLVEMLNKIADVSSEPDAAYYKKTAAAFLDKKVDISPESFNAESSFDGDPIADNTTEVASRDAALDDANSRVFGAIVANIQELCAKSDSSFNNRIINEADFEVHESVGTTIRRVGLDYAATGDDLLVFDNVSDKVYVNRESFPDTDHFEINADGELKPACVKVSCCVFYTALDLLPHLDYPACATTPLEVDRQSFPNTSCPDIFIQDFSTEKLPYDPHLGGVDLAYTAMKNREKFGVQHMWIGWKPKGGKGYEREKGDEADAGAFKGIKVWCDKDVDNHDEEEDDEEDDEDTNSDDESDSSDDDESDSGSDADSSDEESDDDDEFDDDEGGVDVVFG